MENARRGIMLDTVLLKQVDTPTVDTGLLVRATYVLLSLRLHKGSNRHTPLWI